MIIDSTKGGAGANPQRQIREVETRTCQEGNEGSQTAPEGLQDLGHMPRLLSIGDIHGASNALRTLLDLVSIRPDDTVVTLGDYVDRGADVKGALEQLCELKSRTNLIALRGNHEVAMLAGLKSDSAFLDWLRIGGVDTLRSYDVDAVHDLPPHHLEFLQSTRRWHEEERHFFVHANAWPEDDLEAQDDYVLFWASLSSAQPRHKSGKTMICGHTVQRSGIPRNWGTAVCIDTGAGYGLWLTCLDVLSGHYWQANEAGRTREGQLDEGCSLETR
jgi:serine/threonine protein phosphatase 1